MLDILTVTQRKAHGAAPHAVDPRRIQSRLLSGAEISRHTRRNSKVTQTHAHTHRTYTHARTRSLCPIQQHLCQAQMCCCSLTKATSKHRRDLLGTAKEYVQPRAPVSPSSLHELSSRVNALAWLGAPPSALACRVTARAMGWYGRTANKLMHRSPQYRPSQSMICSSGISE